MNRYTLAVLVRNQFGVLNRLTSMFRRRQFNISSITASETESGEYSRITFSFDGEENGKQQLINQLYKLPDVCSIKELTVGNSLSCELMLIKLKMNRLPVMKFMRRRKRLRRKRLIIQKNLLYFELSEIAQKWTISFRLCGIRPSLKFAEQVRHPLKKAHPLCAKT